MSKNGLRPEKAARMCFRTGVRLPSPPPARRKRHIACDEIFMLRIKIVHALQDKLTDFDKKSVNFFICCCIETCSF